MNVRTMQLLNALAQSVCESDPEGAQMIWALVITEGKKLKDVQAKIQLELSLISVNA